jgi:uncharacterized protein YoxC
MKNKEETFDTVLRDKITTIEKLEEEIKNKDKKILDVIRKITDFIPNLQDDDSTIDVLFPNITEIKNQLQSINSKVECPGTNNLIGKIDNECLYFNKDTNKIEPKSNEDIKNTT